MIYFNGFKYFFNEQLLAFPENFQLWVPKICITHFSVKKTKSLSSLSSKVWKYFR